MKRHGHGYMLMEALCAMAVLSISMVAIHGALRQASITRAQARDYTQVRFLLQDRMSELELQPMLAAGKWTGVYDGDLSRFSWETSVERVPIAPPRLDSPPPIPVPGGPPPLEPVVEMGRLTVTVRWTRSGQTFSETVQTLVGPERFEPAGGPA
jgi:hypothetical protein